MVPTPPGLLKTMDSTAVQTAYRLSPMQEGMLFHYLADGASGLDIEQIVVELPEAVDPDFLERAWLYAAQRHDPLRTTFDWRGSGPPLQRVGDTPELAFILHDRSAVPADARDSDFEALRVRDRDAGFQLDRGPLSRVHLVRFAPDLHRCLWTFPHILMDGGSFPLVLRDVWTAYEAFRSGVEPSLPAPPPFRRFVTWLGERSEEGDAAFWRTRLEGFATPTEVSGDGESVESGEEAQGEESLVLPEGIAGTLEALGREHGFTLSTAVLGAWAILLSRYSGEEDVIFGATRAGRGGTVEGAPETVGLFMNTLPVRARVAPERPVLDFLRELREEQVAVRPYEHTPLFRVQQWAGLPPGTPLFQTIVVFDRETLESTMRRHGGRWATRSVRLVERLNSPLTLHVFGEERIRLQACFDRRSFGAARVRRMMRQLGVALAALATNPNRTLGEVPLLSGEEERRILQDWNDTAVVQPFPSLVHGLFEEQVERTPDAPALAFRDETLTYRELNRRANLLAHHLMGIGVGPDTLVGICVERSPDLVVGLLGILKAGGAYVPLDPDYPADRIALMLEDSGVRVLLTQRHLLPTLPEHGARVVLLDRDGKAFASGREDNPTAGVRPENLAYVIYTSGSTGRPKGVMVEHRNVANFFLGMDRELAPEERGSWLSVTSLSFDISVLELFWTLARGFKVVLYDDPTRAPRADEGARAASAPLASTRPLDFSLFYFASDQGDDPGNRYRLLLEGARFADTHGFAAVWTPERHFHAFGGLYPNPAVTGAAIAAITRKVQIRSGSVVLPLHHPARVAEEWSVVDNLSGGRVEVAFASGWHPDDFVLRPENYADRKNYFYRAIDMVRALWRGETLSFPGPNGEVAVRTMPRPVQPELPVWVTTAGSAESYVSAGRVGANLLTHLLGQTLEDVEEKIRAYRRARREAGHEGEGRVALMLHTFVGEDDDRIRELVRRPMVEYLRSSVSLVKNFAGAWEAYSKRASGPVKAQGDEFQHLSPEDMDSLLNFAFERYYETSGLFGSLERAAAMVEKVRAIGVDDIACLVDFGVDTDTTLAHLERLAELRLLVQHSGGSARAEVPRTFADQVRHHGITHLQCTPSMVRMLLSDPESREALRAIGTFLVGGEAFPGPLARDLMGCVGGRVLNMYGPTETTIWSSLHRVGPEDVEGTVPIGRPIANTRLYVTGPGRQPQPVGVPGELLIGGRGVVRGYFERPELTAERFIPDPFVEGERLYRTGDLVRWREDGVLEFLGRLDHQVKIRGHRIELGEIDATLEALPEVSAAVTVAREDTPGDLRLVAYYVPSGASGPALEDRLREHLRGRLPEVMVPAVLVGLERLPLTPNGKVDRKALPAPEAGRRGGAALTPPRNPLEEFLAAVWREALGLDRVGVDDNFFDLGGHSLLAVQVHQRLLKEVDRPVTITDLFRFPTIRALARHLGGAEEERVAAVESGLDRADLRRRSMQQRRDARRG